jgi:hypothetical protein
MPVHRWYQPALLAGGTLIAKSMSIVVASTALATTIILAAGMRSFRHSLDAILQPAKVV